LAAEVKAHFVSFSAVTSGVKEAKAVMEEAARLRRSTGRQTVLFVDEVHRFNKAQQDAFLPYLETGDIVLIGATTENPSFELNRALLSRVKVYVLKPLSEAVLRRLLQEALADEERGLGKWHLQVPEPALARIVALAAGDARVAYTLLELAAVAAVGGEIERASSFAGARVGARGAEAADGRVECGRPPATKTVVEGGVISPETVEKVAQKPLALYDKGGEEHYNLISALHKSIRNSDPDAALYWLARMLEGGADPRFIARRLLRVASEDVGLADPKALEQAAAAAAAVEHVGLPECDLALAQAVVYLSLAPKSNALYRAYSEAKKTVQEKPPYPVPLPLRNPVTGLLASLGYGQGYQYAHDFPEKVAPLVCLPPELMGARFYEPTNEGFEQRLRQRLQELAERRAKSQGEGKHG
jgi:putative ATPase